MNVSTKRALKYGTLLQTASFMALVGSMPVHAQNAAPAMMAADEPATEQVLVTGSLIHGAAAVGVPVSSFGAQEFQDSGAITSADIFKNVPSVVDVQSFNIIDNGGTITENQTVNIHNLSANNGAARTLLLVDGMRFPGMGNGECMIDPSVIPVLAVDHIDLLADGASATYGSDAEAGVVNVNLRRGFDGALTQFQLGASTDFGGAEVTASQLYGRKWDSGDVTVTLSTSFVNHINATAIPSFNQNFFLTDGIDDRILLTNSDPATISIGKPTLAANALGQNPATGVTYTPNAVPGAPSSFTATIGTSCGNCYAVPKGTGGNFATTAPGPTTTWAAIVANTPSVLVNGSPVTQGTANAHNSFQDGWATPAIQTNSGVITFDQDIMPNVQFFGDGFYNNRRVTQVTSTGSSSPYQNNAFITSVPTFNPYFPTGAPSNIMVNYDLSVESPIHVDANEMASRYDFGLNVDLPFSWNGSIHYANSDTHTIIYSTGVVNPNNISAALGYSIAPAGNGGSFVKPAGVPYLNLFCDPTEFACNSPTTLAYIQGYRYIFESDIVQEVGVNFDGPIAPLPAGEIKAAVGGTYDAFAFYFEDKENFNNQSLAQITDSLFPVDRTVAAGFVQLNVPVFGGNFTLPGVEKLDLEGSIRYDHYSDVGGTTNPKVSATWLVYDGLQFKGAWGTAFQAPSPPEIAPTGGLIQGQNSPAGSTTVAPICPSTGVAAVAGTAAAVLNPNCVSSLNNLGGITLSGGAAISTAVRPGGLALSPEKSQNVSLGWEWAPTDNFFKGLDLEATYYFVKIRSKLQACANTGADTTQDASCYITPATYNEPFTNGVINPTLDPQFEAAVLALLNNPKSQLPVTQAASNIAYIFDGGIRNIGWQSVNGVDFNGDYNLDLGGWGDWDTGITGNYIIDNKSQLAAGAPIVSLYSTTVGGYRDSGGRLRYRAHLGWTGGPDDAWGVTTFLNFYPHTNVNGGVLPPECFLEGQTACDASGLPNYAQYTTQYPTLSNFTPGMYTVDLQINYKTHDAPSNEYLKNIGVTLMVTDLFDRSPPFLYTTGAPARSIGAFPGVEQRFILLTVTKAW